jgi:hypothetical protein
MRHWDRKHLIDTVMQRWRWCVAAKGERLNKYVNGQALLAIHKNRFVIFESSKRELFESVNCVLNAKKFKKLAKN